jgi:hypothetical protein
MSNTVYNQQRNLKRQLKRLEVARQLNSNLKRKSARMLKVTKRVSPGRDGTRDQCAGIAAGVSGQLRHVSVRLTP